MLFTIMVLGLIIGVPVALCICVGIVNVESKIGGEQ